MIFLQLNLFIPWFNWNITICNIYPSVKNFMTVQIQELAGRKQGSKHNGPGMKQIQPKSKRNKIRSAWSFDKCGCENEAIVKSSEKLNCCKRTKRKSCKIFSFFSLCVSPRKGKKEKNSPKRVEQRSKKEDSPFLVYLHTAEAFSRLGRKHECGTATKPLVILWFAALHDFYMIQALFDSRSLLRMVSID